MEKSAATASTILARHLDQLFPAKAKVSVGQPPAALGVTPPPPPTSAQTVKNITLMAKQVCTLLKIVGSGAQRLQWADSLQGTLTASMEDVAVQRCAGLLRKAKDTAAGALMREQRRLAVLEEDGDSEEEDEE